MSTERKMICNDCGSLLPHDSQFCQYCGSKNVVEYIEPKPIRIGTNKKCKKCGKTLPDDSQFCQYCGSGEIEAKELYSSNVKRCLNCGKEVPYDSEFCQYCGSNISKDKVVNNNTNNNKVGKENNVSGISFIFIIFITLILFMFYVSSIDNNDLSTKDIDLNYVKNSNKKPVKIIPSLDSDVYVVFKRTSDNKHAGILIEDGEIQTVYLPGGNYQVFFATGEHWIDESSLFGINTWCYSYYTNVVSSIARKNNNTFTVIYLTDNSYTEINRDEFPIN